MQVFKLIPRVQILLGLILFSKAIYAKSWNMKRLNVESFLSLEHFKTNWGAKKEVPLAYVMGVSGSTYLSTYKKKEALHFGFPLHIGDEIETSRDGVLWVFFLDGSTLRMPPYSHVRVSDFSLTPQRSQLAIELLEGGLSLFQRPSQFISQSPLGESDILFSSFKVTPKKLEENLYKDNVDTFLQDFQGKALISTEFGLISLEGGGVDVFSISGEESLVNFRRSYSQGARASWDKQALDKGVWYQRLPRGKISLVSPKTQKHRELGLYQLPSERAYAAARLREYWVGTKTKLTLKAYEDFFQSLERQKYRYQFLQSHLTQVGRINHSYANGFHSRKKALKLGKSNPPFGRRFYLKSMTEYAKDMAKKDLE